jgi:hypothetical protein
MVAVARLVGGVCALMSATSNGRWYHADLVLLFSEAGSELKPAKNGKTYKGGHPYQHDSQSGTCLVAWPEEGRWWCSSCKASGDAADLLVDVGKAPDRQEAERILTERFGPPYTKERPPYRQRQRPTRYRVLWGQAAVLLSLGQMVGVDGETLGNRRQGYCCLLCHGNLKATVYRGQRDSSKSSSRDR